MPKINCNDGCLDNHSAACVKYTGTQIDDPLIIQNTNYNDIVNILVTKIIDITASTPIINVTLTNPASINTTTLDVLYPSANNGQVVFYTNINLDPDAVYRCEKITTNLWITQAGTK